MLHRRRALDIAIDQHPVFAALAGRDRAFAYRLVATVLRRCGQLDDLIDRCLDRPFGPTGRRARGILRLGAAQLLFLATPPHAAVDTSVGLARSGRDQQYRGLINAVLRRLSRDGQEWLADQDAERLNTPDWLWQSWVAAYGAAVTRAIAAAHAVEPPLDLTPKSTDSALAVALGAEVLPTGGWRAAGGGAVADMLGYADGAWWVQDAAAALPVRLFGDVAGKPVIDLCAAPGGKTAQLAAAGAKVTAVDVSRKRLDRLATNFSRLGLTADLVKADVQRWRPAAQAGMVLLDAPCTATGTIRRHPDIAHLKQPADVVQTSRAQDRLLAAAVAMLAPGGVLVYTTCSLQSEEAAERVAMLLSERNDLVREPVAAAEIGGLAEAVTGDGDLRTLPCHLADRGGMDGFYAARLRKTG